jgi:Zn-dependent peptidase ImmA (M78 family)
VAAEALVPKDEFLAAWEMLLDRTTFPSRLSRIFWVSPLVVIVRAFELSKINDKEFFRLVYAEKNKPIQSAKKRKSGGNPINTMLARNSRRLASEVIRALRENRLIHRDAAYI